MRDEKSILPVSHMMHGVYDIDGVSYIQVHASRQQHLSLRLLIPA